MKFAACIEWMFTKGNDDLASRIRAAHAAGVPGVEFHLWREKDLDAIERALDETGVRLVSFCVEPRCSLVDPADHDKVLAAVADAIAPAAPEVTMPDSAPESSASRFPAARCSSKISTKCFEASCFAARTSGSSSEPLRYVHVPRALMNGRTPSFV